MNLPARFAMLPLSEWLLRTWPDPNARANVLAGYQELARMPHLVADIAQLGGLPATSFVPGDPYATAFYEGRRSLALDIIQRAEMDHARLRALVTQQVKPKP